MRAVLDTSVVISTDVPPLAGELAISAATAHAHSALLYTRNASDLAGVDGLLEIVPI